MIVLRLSDQRGRANHGWLDARHSFSFAGYHDPDHMGFRSLRVLNEDRVAPGAGFPEHPHRDMEIVTYMLEGRLQHRDSMGNGAVIRPGEFQYMSAGSGVTHSEFNPSREEAAHLMQIWIRPREKGLQPRYEQRSYPNGERHNRLRLAASPDGADGSMAIRQDALLYTGVFDSGQAAELSLAPGRHAWLQVARGGLRLNDAHDLRAGDAAAFSDEPAVRFVAGPEGAEVVLFDLA